jgi:dehydrogenase/reductase SDR family member 7B
MNLKKKVVIITGATSGIGRACAEVFGKEGARLVITGRSIEKMDAVKKELNQSGIDFLPMIIDAASEDDNRKMIGETIEKYGSIDILINNAGISMRALFNDLGLDTFKKVMDINFYGSVYATKYALPHILKSKGTIVAISSINGHRGTPGRSAYSASKFAMEGFFESLRTELMHYGVHILVVSPGFTGTNIRNAALNKDGVSQGESPRDEAKMMTAVQVAEAILRGVRKRKRDLVLTPFGKLVVFLNKWLPAWMDKMAYREMAGEKDSPFK